MKKAKAIELLKLAVPIKALTQQEYSDFVEAVNMGMDTLAQPEPQEGEWEQVSAQRYFMSASYFYRCSACGVNNVRNTNYCPNCGAKMKGERQK